MKNSLKKIYADWRKRFRAFKTSPAGQRVIKIVTHVFQIIIIGVIAYQLTGIGWGKVWNSLPVNPFFYLLFLFIYFLLPFSEALAYKICWGIPYFKSISIFIKKRIFNKDVMGYSGEVVLMQWGLNSMDTTKKQVFKDIRDMNILSSAASTFVAFGLLFVLILTGQIQAMDYIFNTDALEGVNLFDYILGSLFAIILIAVGYRFRKYLFSMPLGMSIKVFSIHSLRMLALYAAQILQWHIVLPDIGLDVWFTFLSVNILISRIPFIPSHELVATGTNIELAKILQAPVAAISGLFLVHDVLGKILNLCFYVFYTWREKLGTGTTLGLTPKEENKS
ncbi:MAG: hypothetical protein ACQEST_11215 [Bacteroidota bacterium]